MSKYTIEVFLNDVTGFESVTTLSGLTYFELLETYALINALKYHEAKILLHSNESNKQLISIEAFINNISTEKMIYELSHKWSACPNNYNLTKEVYNHISF